MRVQRDSVIVACMQDIKAGDGIVFETGSLEHEEPGGTVVKVCLDLQWLGESPCKWLRCQHVSAYLLCKTSGNTK